MSQGALPKRRLSDHVVAALVTAAVPTALASVWLWLSPQGCALRAEPATYRWSCLLPGLLLTVAPVTALVFGAGAMASERLARLIGVSRMATAAVWGVLVHLFLIGSLVASDPGYVAIFLWDVLLIPQPIVAGAGAAAIYVGALHLRGRGAVG